MSNCRAAAHSVRNAGEGVPPFRCLESVALTLLVSSRRRVLVNLGTLGSAL